MSFKRLSFELTNACNLDCVHCMRENKARKEYIPFEVVSDVVSQAMSYNISMVVLTGGEPTIHPRFEDIIDNIIDHQVEYYFVTNGQSLDKIKAVINEPRRRKWLQCVSMSLDGATEKTNDKVRGQGTYKKVMRAIALCKAMEIPVTLKFSVNKLNESELEKFALMAHYLGVKNLEISHMHPTHDLIKAGLMLDPGEWKDIDVRISKIRDKLNMTVIACAGGYFRFPFGQCNAMSMEDIHVDYRGNLAFCCLLPGYRGASNRNGEEKEIIADLADVSLADAHKMLLDRLAEFNKDKIDLIKKGEFGELDHFLCLYCLRYFNKMDWAKDHPAWLRENYVHEKKNTKSAVG